MFSRYRFLLSPWGTAPTLAFVGGSHADLKPLIFAIKRVGSSPFASDACTSPSRPAALFGRSSGGPCRWQSVESPVLDSGVVSVLQKKEG